MTPTPHELAEEFPDKAEQIHQLKTSDAHFRRLFDQYHIVNRAIRRAETQVEPVEDIVETTMRKERMVLRDQIAAMFG